MNQKHLSLFFSKFDKFSANILKFYLIISIFKLPSTAYSCAVCFSGSEESLEAYYLTTVFLTLLPIFMLASIVASDSFAAGIVGTVNITFLTSLVSSKYTGFQYALLTSIMAFLGKVFGGFSGVLVENFQSMYGFNYGWMSFYIFTSILAVPAMLLIYLNRNFFFKNESFN